MIISQSQTVTIKRFFHSLPSEPFIGKKTFVVKIGQHQLERIVARCDPSFVLHSLRIDEQEQLHQSFPACILSDPFVHLFFSRNTNPNKIVTIEVENVGRNVFPTWKNRNRLSRKKWIWRGPPHLDLSPRVFPCALICTGYSQ